MPTVFLSRDRRTAGLFAELMQEAGWSLQAISLLVFRAEPFELPAVPLDWLFFYSRKGVRFFRRAHQLPSGCKLAAMGKGTAEEMRTQGWPVDFVGDGDPPRVAEAFGELAAGTRVGFVQARQSRQSVEQLLATRVECIPLVAYDNVPKSEVSVRPADYLVFTSPMNFTTYHQHYPISPTSRYVAIGESTARCMRDAGVSLLRVSGQPSQRSLAATVLVWESEEPRLA
jgi:uroporphyrinogen-III synthase